MLLLSFVLKQKKVTKKNSRLPGKLLKKIATQEINELDAPAAHIVSPGVFSRYSKLPVGLIQRFFLLARHDFFLNGIAERPLRKYKTQITPTLRN